MTIIFLVKVTLILKRSEYFEDFLNRFIMAKRIAHKKEEQTNGKRRKHYQEWPFKESQTRMFLGFQIMNGFRDKKTNKQKKKASKRQLQETIN